MLNFYWGAVGSGKTLTLLREYADLKRLNQKNVLLVKPLKDTRTTNVYSRFGPMEAIPDIYLADTPESLAEFSTQAYGAQVVLVDEVQFLAEPWIEKFRELADAGIEVRCYGLRNDSNRNLFPTSLRLLNVADNIIEIPSTCECCGAAAKFSQIKQGSEPGVGFGYFGVCSRCYRDHKQPNL